MIYSPLNASHPQPPPHTHPSQAFLRPVSSLFFKISNFYTPRPGVFFEEKKILNPDTTEINLKFRYLAYTHLFVSSEKFPRIYFGHGSQK
jgi:hypothetical protein